MNNRDLEQELEDLEPCDECGYLPCKCHLKCEDCGEVRCQCDIERGWDEEEFHIDFEHPGGNSALRRATEDNPRNLPCPTCGTPNRLTPADRDLGYQCNSCADALERGGEINYYDDGIEVPCTDGTENHVWVRPDENDEVAYCEICGTGEY